MPSHYDNTYNYKMSEPSYDTDHDKLRTQIAREADAVLEMRPPPVPSREQEIAYIDWLAEDLRSDPWLTHRFRKYTAGPKRVPWKNYREISWQHKTRTAVAWLFGSAMLWPISIAVGRRMKHYQGGVGVVPYQRY